MICWRFKWRTEITYRKQTIYVGQFSHVQLHLYTNVFLVFEAEMCKSIQTYYNDKLFKSIFWNDYYTDAHSNNKKLKNI